MFVKLMSFYFMNSIAVFSVMFSHIFAEKINFCCNFRSVTHTLNDHLTAVSGVGSSPALATCETSSTFLVNGYAYILPYRLHTYLGLNIDGSPY